MSQRIFTFPVALLLGQSRRLLAALRDATDGPAVLKRLKTGFDATLETQIATVEKGGGDQKTAGGGMVQLTQAQSAAYTEMERLTSGARHSASLAFAKGDPRLHIQFSVGMQDQPHDLDHELEFANNILTGCKTYATQMAEQGWTADDTTALGTAITTLTGNPAVRDTANAGKKTITSTRNTAANALYKMCLSEQNAARLAYPVTQVGTVDGVAEARSHFLLDEFPPRDGGGSTPSPTPAPAPTTPTH